MPKPCFCCLPLALWLLAAALPAQAAPRLVCELRYAGALHTLEAEPVVDPYGVPAQDVGGRFRFKPVLVGQGDRVDRVLLYAYFNTPQQPVLIQQAKYLPPFASPGPQGPIDLTGQQHLYAGHMERELIYRCTLHGVRP
ncbi:MAG: hypothetical protein RL559_1380 [Pseudomonadota bacterium]